MPRFRLLVALLVSAMTPAVGTAAGRAPAPQGLLDRAERIAVAYWHAAPCEGRLQLLRGQDLTAGVDAWVTFDSALGANDLAAPAAGYSACTVAFSGRRWPTTTSMAADWDLLCMTMVHEVGHLLGHPHEAAGIMAPVFTSYAAEPSGCRDHGLRGFRERWSTHRTTR